MRYWLRECSRCRGDFREEWDVWGRYISCLQCGYIVSQVEEACLFAVGTLKEWVPIARAA